MAGGSQILISDKGIKITTNGKIIYQAGEHVFEGGKAVKYDLPMLPKPQAPYILQYLVQDKSKQPIADTPYIIMDEDGNLEEGITDSEGFMNITSTDASKELFTRVITNEIEEAQDAVSEGTNNNG